MNKLAKIIRAITIPTLLFFATLFVLYFARPECFPTAAELCVPLCLIGIFPLLAYVVAFILKSLRKIKYDNYRNTQRTLAFIFSDVGYTAAFVLSVLLKLDSIIIRLTATYFFSVIILAIFNLCRLKASGHACGIAGPILFFCYNVGWIYLFPCVVIYVLSFWSSI